MSCVESFGVGGCWSSCNGETAKARGCLMGEVKPVTKVIRVTRGRNGNRSPRCDGTEYIIFLPLRGG